MWRIFTSQRVQKDKSILELSKLYHYPFIKEIIGNNSFDFQLTKKTWFRTMQYHMMEYPRFPITILTHSTVEVYRVIFFLEFHLAVQTVSILIDFFVYIRIIFWNYDIM